MNNMKKSPSEQKNNWDIISEETERHKFELVLEMGGHEIVMLTGCQDVPNDDYYYEFMDWRGKITLSSCVITFIPLREYLPKGVYANLCDVFFINAIEPQMQACELIKKSLQKQLGRKPSPPIWG